MSSGAVRKPAPPAWNRLSEHHTRSQQPGWKDGQRVQSCRHTWTGSKVASTAWFWFPLEPQPEEPLIQQWGCSQVTEASAIPAWQAETQMSVF